MASNKPSSREGQEFRRKFFLKKNSPDLLALL